MAVRVEKRRGKRRLIIDIRYRKPNGTKGRYRHDAEVQTHEGARAEDRRLMALVASTGSPIPVNGELDANVATATSEVRTAAPSFGALVDQYLESYATSRLKPSTKRGYTTVLRGFLVPRLGKLPIDRIDANAVRELDVELVRRKVTPSTRHNVQSILRSVLGRFAVEAGYLGEPPRLPKMPRVGTRAVHTLSRTEVNRLLDAACPEHRLAFLLALQAGLRAGEIRGLRVRDVHLDKGYLVVRQSICRGEVAAPKSGHERVIPLTPQLHEVLARSPKRPPGAPVTTTSRGTPWGEFSLYKAFLAACKRGRIEGWRFHDLRHYFVTSCFRAGVPAPTVQSLAGHAHLATTQRYAHVDEEDLVEGMRRLGQQWGNKPSTTLDAE